MADADGYPDAKPADAPASSGQVRRTNAAAEDRVFAAMASRVRRRILDLLRQRPMTTGQIAGRFPSLSRFAVMQHLKVLGKARLVIVERQGRQRHNHLNIVPIHQALHRWVQPGESDWSRTLGSLKADAEREDG